MPSLNRRLPRALLLLAVGLPLACASGGSAGSGTPAGRGDITPEEIGTRSNLDLYTLVSQMRPQWLRGRGQMTPVGGLRSVRVVIDSSLQPGGADVLRTLRGSQVTRIRYLNGQDATTRYGLDVEAGVIEVTTGARGGGG
ncbi:MAG: hypothetical protein R3E10_12605 [Gemmatimonadota bacterium]